MRRDDRQGHPSKLREPVRRWLELYGQAHPVHSWRLIQAALADHGSRRVSSGHSTRVRAADGLQRRPR